MKDWININIGWATLWRTLMLFLLVVVFYLARQVVGVLLIGVVLSLGFDPVVSALEARKIPRILGTLLIFLTALIVLSAIVYFVIPVVAIELGGFAALVNRILASLSALNIPAAVSQNFSMSFTDALNFFSSPNFSITGAIAGFFSQLLLVIATIMISFYLTVDHDGTDRLLRGILPSAYEEMVLRVFDRFKLKIRRWLGAQLALSAIMGLVFGLGLWAMGVQYPLVLGVLGAAFELVPIIGPIITGAVAFAVALGQSFSLGLYVVLFSFLAHQLENHILVPLVMGRTMRVHPVIVVVAVLAGAHVGGLIGVILAVPVAVLAQEVFERMSERKSQRPALGI